MAARGGDDALADALAGLRGAAAELAAAAGLRFDAARGAAAVDDVRSVEALLRALAAAGAREMAAAAAAPIDSERLAEDRRGGGGGGGRGGAAPEAAAAAGGVGDILDSVESADYVRVEEEVPVDAGEAAVLRGAGGVLRGFALPTRRRRASSVVRRQYVQGGAPPAAGGIGDGSAGSAAVVGGSSVGSAAPEEGRPPSRLLLARSAAGSYATSVGGASFLGRFSAASGDTGVAPLGESAGGVGDGVERDWWGTSAGGWGGSAGGVAAAHGGRRGGGGGAGAGGGGSAVAREAGDLFLPGDISDRWELGAVLNHGSSSRVHVAHRARGAGAAAGGGTEKAGGGGGSDGPERVAVKVIDKRSPSYQVEHVCREVSTHRLVMLAGGTGGGSRIVDVYEVWEDARFVYIVMELLEGGELFRRISTTGKYTEKHAARLVVSMLEALRFCHHLNITHRDVKPENFVFLHPEDSDGGDRHGINLKLIDFGICHYTEDPNAMCRTLCGTPLYIAPEVFFRQPYGKPADMWSLGVIVYIMLVGHPPFDDPEDNMPRIIRKIKFQPVQYDERHFGEISAEARDFLSCLLDKDAANRMSAIQALEHKWLKDSCRAASEARLDIAQSTLNQLFIGPDEACSASATAAPCDDELPSATAAPVDDQPALDSGAPRTVVSPAPYDPPATAFNSQAPVSPHRALLHSPAAVPAVPAATKSDGSKPPLQQRHARPLEVSPQRRAPRSENPSVTAGHVIVGGDVGSSSEDESAVGATLPPSMAADENSGGFNSGWSKGSPLSAQRARPRSPAATAAPIVGSVAKASGRRKSKLSAAIWRPAGGGSGGGGVGNGGGSNASGSSLGVGAAPRPPVVMKNSWDPVVAGNDKFGGNLAPGPVRVLSSSSRHRAVDNGQQPTSSGDEFGPGRLDSDFGELTPPTSSDFSAIGGKGGGGLKRDGSAGGGWREDQVCSDFGPRAQEWGGALLSNDFQPHSLGRKVDGDSNDAGPRSGARRVRVVDDGDDDDTDGEVFHSEPGLSSSRRAVSDFVSSPLAERSSRRLRRFRNNETSEPASNVYSGESGGLGKRGSKRLSGLVFGHRVYSSVTSSAPGESERRPAGASMQFGKKDSYMNNVEGPASLRSRWWKRR